MRMNSFKAVGMVLILGFLIVGLSGVAFADDGTYRTFLKTGGLIAAILGIVGISIAGYLAGKNYDS